MAKYLVEGSYTTEGLHGLMKDKASGRKSKVQAALKSVKAKMDCIYFGLNGADIFMIVDAPDAPSVAIISILAMASGAVDMTVTQLMTVDELDTALNSTAKYVPPGA